jgi:hypothetical protein
MGSSTGGLEWGHNATFNNSLAKLRTGFKVEAVKSLMAQKRRLADIFSCLTFLIDESHMDNSAESAA